jgi:hypothetical protein
MIASTPAAGNTPGTDRVQRMASLVPSHHRESPTFGGIRSEADFL